MQTLESTSQTSGRLDAVLSKTFDISRSSAAQLIKDGQAFVDGKTTQKLSAHVAEGCVLSICVHDDVTPSYENSEIVGVEKLYEDDDLLIVSKPSGLVTHPAPSLNEPTLCDWLKQQNIPLSALSGEGREGVVHRLDKETSGVLAVAKNDESYLGLKAQLMDKSMGRIYLSVIDCPLKSNQIVEKSLGRNKKNRLKISVDKDGREAKSAFLKLLTNENKNIELIAAKLFTGRTHQIRAHLASLGRHIIGDTLYGFKSPNDTISQQRVMLHAYRLHLVHPTTGLQICVISPPPDDFLSYALNFFGQKEFYESIQPDNLSRSFDAFC